jgi:hypothetical protein
MNPLFRHLRGTHLEGCLSLYLQRGPGYDQRFYDALLKDFEKELPDVAGVARELVRARAFLADMRPPGVPLAIFSCAPDGVFDARRLPDDVEPQAVFGERFDLNQLAAQLERHPPGVVAVVEKASARLYSVVLEDLRELEELEGESVVRDIRPDHQTRRPEAHARRNLKRAVDRLLQLASPKRGFEAIYLAGPAEARNEFRELLPKQARERVRAELGVTLDTPPTELAQQLRELT